MGNMYSQIYPPKSLFSVDQIPDLTGQVMLVTGGNAGIGKETCKALLNGNAKVYLAARSKSKADEAIEWLKQETNGKAPIFLELDLANLDSIRKAVEEFKSKEQELHVLFNNAGVMKPPIEQKTANGYDLQFGTNVLGPYFFTTLLLPTLIHTVKNSPLARGHARVVNTSSSAVYFAPEVVSFGKHSGNVLFSNRLAKHYADQGIISSSLNPGSIRTELQRHLPWLVREILALLFHHPASYGALTQLWSGTMPEGETHNGQFLIPWARLGDPGQYGRDEKLGEKLWVWLEEQVKGH
ncbi:oxidoreductase, putative, partial [Rhizoctonia solani AG-3 Rhs1AP]